MTGLQIDPPRRLTNDQINPIAEQLVRERRRWIEALRRWISESRLHCYDRFGQTHAGSLDDDAFISLQEIQSLTLAFDPELPEDMAHVTFTGSLGEPEYTTGSAGAKSHAMQLGAPEAGNVETVKGNPVAPESAAERRKRRYKTYRDMGGDFSKTDGEWRLTGGIVNNLEQQEKQAGRRNADRKSISKELKKVHEENEAAQREGEPDRWRGLGSRRAR